AEPSRARQRFGVVSQANTLDRSLDARENLMLHGRYFGMSARSARQAADEWLEAFHLSGKARARIGELSGGMARRLMLARAMVHGPDVLFLDEPTAGLDPQSRAALWDIVRELRELGRTVVVSTHYIEEADQFCDRVAIMDNGVILALDTPRELKRAHGTGVSITVRGEGDPARLARSLELVHGARVVVLDDSVRVQLASGDGALGKVITAVERGGSRLTDVSMSEDSLETVFINLTGRDLRE
ncbi:MAG TPA: ATP-binding cassette domain-containing protein, partial [Candidatus Dormibacteraeota bacterium]|nr:ATP-binding cassette domain-containing protein [Candidatus Dormibacteraeota bacterium]